MAVIVTENLIKSVPLELIENWEQFQTFSADLLKIKENVLDAREYLTQGATQDGIDVYATQSGADKLIVIQCKQEKSLSPSDIDQIFEEFLSKSFASKTAKFIICTTADLKKRKLEDSIEVGRLKLLEKGIDLQLWDPEGINRELRTNPQQALIAFVARYFTPPVAKRFYGDIYLDFIKEWKKVAKHTYTLPQNYVTRRLIQHSDYYDRNEFKYRHFDKVDNRKPLYDILHPKDSGNRLIILSVGGFGKSTELQHLAGLLSKDDEPYFPVFHVLRDYVGQPIDQILSLHDIDWNNVPEESLILILDGLDEIKATHFDDFIRQINLFADAKPKASIVISSRFNFYDVTTNHLRGFQIFVLEEFSNKDIEHYLQMHIPGKEVLFNNKLHESKLTEYSHSPYYLVRLVRFFNVDATLFPKTKSEFFERTLFERIDDESKRLDSIGSEDRKYLIELVQRVAFCMTLCGESTIDNIALEEIVPNVQDRQKLHRYFLLNKHEKEQDHWSFEHKNLQEYLCASCLVAMSFDKLLQTITFQSDFKKIQPKFLNTLSFLYSMTDIAGKTLHKLVDWLLENEPDVLVRFEKNRIPQDFRLTILKSIFRYYKEKGVFFFSSVLQVRDVADFIEIDKPVIDFLEEEIFKDDTSDRFCFDIISLLELCKTPWVHRKQLESILFRVLDENKRNSQVLADAISALRNMNFVELNVLQKIFAAPIDKEDFHIRKAIVHFINEVAYANQYMPFLLASVPIYIKGQKAMSYAMANEMLVKVIVKSIDQENIQLLLRAIVNKEINLSYPGYGSKSFISSEDFGHILKKAASFYSTRPTLLRIVYRAFRSLDHIVHKKEWVDAFKYFFNTTGTYRIVFDKLRKYHPKNMDAAILINNELCEQLIQEYKDGKITDDGIRYWRNMANYFSEIGDWFYKRLLDEFKTEFEYENAHIDYNGIRDEYKIKNQEMVLDKDLFLSEVQKIFTLIGKAEVSSEDWYDYDNKELMAHQPSMAYDVTQRLLFRRGDNGKRVMSFSDMQSIYANDATWKWFQIKRVKELLEKKDEVVRPELKLLASDWCKAKIEILDFDSAITQNGSSFSINSEVHFVQELFLLLDLKLEDHLLLRMLSSDFGYLREDDRSLSGRIIKMVNDQALLRGVVIENIRSKKLAFNVVSNHFAICAQLGFAECLGDLFKFITENHAEDFYQLQELSDHYVILGGSIQDFKQFIVQPVASEKEHIIHTEWNWYLIRKMLNEDPTYIKGMMEKVIDDPALDDGQKTEACRLLLQLGELKGIEYWKAQVLEKEKLIFNSRDQSFFNVKDNNAIALLLDMLETVYTTELYKKLPQFDSIEDAIYGMLHTIAIGSEARFRKIVDGLKGLYEKHKNEKYALTIAYRKELMMQEFFMKNEPSLTVANALAVYQGLKLEPSIVG